MPVYSSHVTSYGDLRLGGRIREERQRQGVTLSELGRRSNISIGRLSEIENEQHVLDVRQVFAIAQALGVRPDAFLPEEVSFPYQISRYEARGQPPRRSPMLDLEKDQLVDHRHTFWPLADLFVGRHIEPVLGQVAQVADKDLDFSCHHENEFIFVLKGKLEFLMKTWEGLKREELSPGDCIILRSDVPHTQRSLQAEPVESLHVFSGSSIPLQTGWDWISPSPAGYITKGELDCTIVIGKQLKILRQQHGWSTAEAARLAGVTERQLEAIESASKPAPLDLIIKLARAFGQPLRQFISGMEKDRPYYLIRRSKELVCIRPRMIRKRDVRHPNENQIIFYPLVAGFPARHMYPYLIRVPNRDPDDIVLVEHHGEVFLYVLEGQLELRLLAERGEVREMLRAGDACFLDMTVPHLICGQPRNPYAETSAQVLAIFWCPLGEDYLFVERPE